MITSALSFNLDWNLGDPQGLPLAQSKGTHTALSKTLGKSLMTLPKPIKLMHNLTCWQMVPVVPVPVAYCCSCCSCGSNLGNEALIISHLIWPQGHDYCMSN